MVHRDLSHAFKEAYLSENKTRSYNLSPDTPTIVQISRNYTVIPGQEVSLICAARGTPVPTVRWVVPETLEVASEFTQTMTTSAAGITFTGNTGNTAMRYR